MTRSTRSVDEKPACKPALPFASCMNTGGPQAAPCLQLITPSPNSPPTMKPAFFIPGITTTHSALFQTLSGIFLSCMVRISVSTVVALLSVFALSAVLLLAPKAIGAASRAATPTIMAFVVRMASLPPIDSAICDPVHGTLFFGLKEMAPARRRGWAPVSHRLRSDHDIWGPDWPPRASDFLKGSRWRPGLGQAGCCSWWHSEG